MSPFLKPDTLILVNRLSYFFMKPKVEEVVVIKNPNKKDHEIKYLVKRIKKIEENKYFVQVDNLRKSIDSRNFGFISKNDILGKVIAKL